MLLKASILDQTSIPVAAKGLDAYSMRGKAINDNLANINTPGYRRIEVSFEDQLRQALDRKTILGDRTENDHMFLGRPDLDKVQPQGYRAEDITNPSDVNNVDIDLESAKLAENQIAFNFSVKFIKERMSDIEASIKLSGLGGE